MSGTDGQSFRYYRAAGRSLEAIELHRKAVQAAIEEVRSFVMLCGAERALGGPRISGLHFVGKLPPGWIRNASAPHMAIPDTDTVRGNSFAHKMAHLRIPDNAEFALLIGVDSAPSSVNPNAPLITVEWPSYVRLRDGWAIRCPLDEKGRSANPPDALPLSEKDYKKLALSPSFNLAALDSENSPEN
jgi:hypothetical protein